MLVGLTGYPSPFLIVCIWRDVHGTNSYAQTCMVLCNVTLMATACKGVSNVIGSWGTSYLIQTVDHLPSAGDTKIL